MGSEKNVSIFAEILNKLLGNFRNCVCDIHVKYPNLHMGKDNRKVSIT